jgi:hypothetical protein
MKRRLVHAAAGLALVPVVFSILATAHSIAQEAGAGTPLFTAYPQYSAKFDLPTETFTLVTNMLVYDTSGKTFTDVTFKQTYPEGITVKETFQRAVGQDQEAEEQSARRRVDGNTFYASMQTFKPRQYVVIFNELVMARRLSEITFPGLEISYTDPEGNRQTTKLPDNTYNLFKYSNVVGSMKRFLDSHNNITFDFAKAVPNRKEWEFAPIAARAKGSFPTGIIGTEPKDLYNGYFRIRTGPPGDTIQVLVVYKQTDKRDKIAEKERLMKELRDTMRWCGEFEFGKEDLQVEQNKWKGYKEVWNVSGRWVDSVKNRLGEGPLEAHVFFGPREDVEYFVIGLAHGRGLGEASATANPVKEKALAAEMHALLETFKSGIVPLASER